MTPNESLAALLPTIDELTKRQAHDDPVFAAWRDSVPDKHWVKIDLSALRIGYELGRAIASTAPGASESRGSVPDEFVLVPREATDDMLSAGHDALDDGHKTGAWGECPGVNYGDARRCFAAMLAAAPAPPAVSNGEPPNWAIAQAFRETPMRTTMDSYEFVQQTIKRARVLARSAAAKGEGSPPCAS